jgi:putative phosphoserine phosphatase/1-acylglycerol-3-phosphate O-acyltransferase
VAGRNSSRLNPGTVDIAVLPPVSVEDWTIRNYRVRIERIRERYLELLADWPKDSLDSHYGTPP